MEDVNLREIMSALRELAKQFQNDQLNEMDLQKGKSFAAKCYLSHTNRKITLNNEQFQLVLDILRMN